MIESYIDFLRDARKLSEAEFMAQHPHSVLVIEPFASEDAAVYATRSASPERGHDRGVASLCKREGSNAFRMMVTIGRAKNNDVHIPCGDVSKFHAYVLTKPKGASLEFADAGSTFGSKVNEERLAARVPKVLSSGMRLELGSVRAVYYEPQDFRELLVSGGVPPI